MPIPVDALKTLATHAIYGKFGSEISKACALLLFGGTNVPALIDPERLLDAALDQPDIDISDDRALAAITAAAKATFAANLQTKASGAISAGTLASDAVDQAVSFIIAADA